MKKQVIVLSLGGSLIIPNEIDLSYLLKLKKVLLKNSKKYKFVIVCGGGSIARTYISALKKAKISETLQSYSGISATRSNARFMNYLFNKDAKYGIPSTTETLEKYLKKQNIVFCGALEYKPNQTSDSTTATLAKHFKTVFINLTNIAGLYDKNPVEYKDAKFIPKITWKEFLQMANKIKYSPGQHFVLDQKAAKIICQNKIPTYIMGNNPKQLNNFLNNKSFTGTIIKN
jgi:uridylate kinase